MSALFQQTVSLWQARALCWVLTRREVAARYAGTALGIAWAYVQPALTVGAYYLVFDVVFAMRLAKGAPTQAVGEYLIVGMLPWMAFSDAISRAMNSLVEAGNILQKNALPPMLFPVRAVMASGLVYAPLMILLVLAYLPKHQLSNAVLAMIPLIGLQWIMCAIWGAALAILTAALRDTTQMVTFALSVGVFVSPILFPAQMFPAGWQWVLWINPMTPWILGYQDVLLQGVWPAYSAWLGAIAWLTAGACMLNVLLRRSRDHLVDWL